MTGAILGALFGGISALHAGRKQREFIATAANHFRALGTEEAHEIASLIEQNPGGATQYVEEVFGGWDKLYMQVKERALKRKAAERLQHLQASGASAEEMVASMAPMVAAGEIAPEQANSLLKYIEASTESIPDWFTNAYVRGGKFDPQKLARAIKYGQETGDWFGAVNLVGKRVFAPTKPDKPDIDVVWGKDGKSYTLIDGKLAGPGPLPGDPTQEARTRAIVELQRHHSGEAPLSDDEVKRREAIIAIGRQAPLSISIGGGGAAPVPFGED